jgi:hypothetical protein
MRNVAKLLLPAILLTMSSFAFADPDKDESGHGRKHDRRSQKVEFWDGNCKVERKFEKNGGYKEERKCKGNQVYYQQPQPVYVPAPVYVEPGGVVIQGTVHVR